jgi:hypothetical protein
MPIFPDFPDFDDFDLEMIDILIKKEREEQNNAKKGPFLQLPVPNMPEKTGYYEEIKKNQDNETIIIDL